MSERTEDAVAGNDKSLILYYHPYSYYSQKVLMTLYEKGIPFQHKVVNIIREQQYEPWYLKLNPRGEVPVLQDSGKIIPDSVRIMDYIEDNFSAGETPRLVPMELGAEIRQKVNFFRQLVDKLPAGIITMGSLFQPELIGKPKIPFIAPVRNAVMNAEKNSVENLKKVAEKNPDIKHILIQKAYAQESKHKIVTSKEEFARVLASVDMVLDECEKLLSERDLQEEKSYLVTDQFTIADVSLTIFLNRLYELGFEDYFWMNDKRPNIEKYYEKVRHRDSFRKTIPGKFYLVRSVIQQQGPVLIGVTLAAAVAVVFGGFILFRKSFF